LLGVPSLGGVAGCDFGVCGGVTPISDFEADAQAIQEAAPWVIRVVVVCAATPGCIEALGVAASRAAMVVADYAIYKGVQAVVQIYQRGKNDPITGLKPVNPGRDPSGTCKPCPSAPPPWEAPGSAHGSTTGTHWHWIEWNQDPVTCTCYLKRVSGPTSR